MLETQVRFLGGEDRLEKEMATHSSILVWEISHPEDPGGLQSTGLQRVELNWATKQQNGQNFLCLPASLPLSCTLTLGLALRLALANGTAVNLMQV